METGSVTHKAVVLARGLGKRMRKGEGRPLAPDAERAARDGLKGLIPFQGRPFLDYVMGSLIEAGLRRICLVIAPDADALKDYARRTSDASGAEITWSVQQEPRGTADAVLAAAEFVGDEAFVMSNCDNLYPREALRQLAGLSGPECCVAAFDSEEMVRQSNFAPERVRSFAVVVSSRDGLVEEIVEKPAEPERYVRDGRLWVNMNLYRFTPPIFDACRRIEPHPERKELELTSAVALLAREGRVPFRVIQCRGGVLDLTSRDDVGTVEKLLKGRTPAF